MIVQQQEESDNTEEQWECVEDCPVRIMGEQSGNLKSGALKPIAYALLQKQQQEQGQQHTMPLGNSENGVERQEEEYDCVEDCPMRVMGEQSGISKSKAGKRGRPWSGEGSHEGWKREAHQHYTDGYSGIEDSGTAARYFQQFPPDSLFFDSTIVEDTDRL